MKRSWTRRGTSRLEPKPDLRSKKPTKKLRRVGNNKHSRDWAREWPSLKREFERANIVTCEARFKGCWIDNGLTPAHSLKRRLITSRSEMREVALLCISCHRVCDEEMSHEEMAQTIRGIISRREVRP